MQAMMYASGYSLTMRRLQPEAPSNMRSIVIKYLRMVSSAFRGGALDARHLVPGQTLHINQEHVILVLAVVVHSSKHEQASIWQHSAAVACACWRSLASFPWVYTFTCLQPCCHVIWLPCTAVNSV